MSSSLTSSSLAPEFKGYRIRQRNPNEQQQQAIKQTLIKVMVRNETNGIPKIRHDVICNGKHYPFIPLFSFTSEEDLGIVEQISTIVLKDQNEILCEILSGRVKQIKVSQFQDIKQRLKSIFVLQLKVDPEQLFLLIISDQISKQSQFNDLFDSISETEFVTLIKRIYQNCPNRVIPKILRKINKYFNSTKARPNNSIERLKRFLKIVKSVDEGVDETQNQEKPTKSLSRKRIQQEEDYKNEKPKTIRQNEVKKQQLTSLMPQKKIQQSAVTVQTTTDVSVPKQSQKVVKKVSQIEKVKTTQKVTKKHRVSKIQKTLTPNKQQPLQQNQQYWQDVESSQDDEEDIKDSINKMAFNGDQSDEDLKYLGPKKKYKKQRNNITIPIDPEFEYQGKKQQRLKKQKKNKEINSPSHSNKNQKRQFGDRQGNMGRKNQRQNNFRNGPNNNDQNIDKGRRQWSKEKKVDFRVLLGLNGASDQVWRDRLRPSRYPRNQGDNSYQSRNQNLGESKERRINKSAVGETPTKDNKSNEPVQQPKPSNKNLTLQRIFTLPDDAGKPFKFQKRNYNLFVNKLFWVNISDGQVTIQKDGKGYIRKSPVQIIDNGKGIVAEGITIIIDGVSNLEDGGTAFGDPVFEQFTPDGQWFHLSSLQVYAYM